MAAVLAQPEGRSRDAPVRAHAEVPGGGTDGPQHGGSVGGLLTGDAATRRRRGSGRRWPSRHRPALVRNDGEDDAPVLRRHPPLDEAALLKLPDR